MKILDEFPLTAKQKDQLSHVMSKEMPLKERRTLFGKWLRENVFSQASES